MRIEDLLFEYYVSVELYIDVFCYSSVEDYILLGKVLEIL